MADDADRAQILEERERARGITDRKPEGPAATGECLWCGDPVEQGRRWCGVECRDMWQAMRR